MTLLTPVEVSNFWKAQPIRKTKQQKSKKSYFYRKRNTVKVSGELDEKSVLGSRSFLLPVLLGGGGGGTVGSN